MKEKKLNCPTRAGASYQTWPRPNLDPRVRLQNKEYKKLDNKQKKFLKKQKNITCEQEQPPTKPAQIGMRVSAVLKIWYFSMWEEKRYLEPNNLSCKHYLAKLFCKDYLVTCQSRWELGGVVWQGLAVMRKNYLT